MGCGRSPGSEDPSGYVRPEPKHHQQDPAGVETRRSDGRPNGRNPDRITIYLVDGDRRLGKQ
jgi:hypothetical protein